MCVAFQALEIIAGEKMARTDGFGRVLKQEAIRTSSLISVMLDDERLSRERGQKKRSDRRACGVNHIRLPNELQELTEARAANYAKWERTVVVVTCWRLCRQSHIEFCKSLFISELSEAASKGKDYGLHPADTGRKEMAVDEEFHCGICWETSWERNTTTCKTIPTPMLVIRD